MKTEKKKRAKPYAANNVAKKMLEDNGWTCHVVEQVVPHCFFKRDAFNFGDILCVSATRGIMLVQVTGGGHHADRIAKIKAEARAGIWLAAGGRIQVWSFDKQAGSKERKLRITNIVKEIADEKESL